MGDTLGTRLAMLFGAALLWTSVSGSARAAAAPPPAARATSAPEFAAKSVGPIDGIVSAIDYKSGMMSVATVENGVKRSYDVLVVPGTNISGPKDFYTIADLKKGAHVQVLMSRKGSTNTAQIIRLR